MREIKCQNRTGKGFTLVEMAIVLIIIGLILGMVVKGKSLVESARFKTDLVKIKHWELAYIQEKLATNKSTYQDYWTINTLAQSKQNYERYLSPQDFIFTSNNSSDMFAAQANRADGFKAYLVNNISGGIDSLGSQFSPPLGYEAVMLLRFSNITATDPNASFVAKRLVCSIEKAIDDRNVYGGNGRIWNWVTWSAIITFRNIPDSAFENCSTFARSLSTSDTVGYYWVLEVF